MRPKARGLSDTGPNLGKQHLLQGAYEGHESKYWESEAMEATPMSEFLSLFSPSCHQEGASFSCSSSVVIKARPVSLRPEGQGPGSAQAGNVKE